VPARNVTWRFRATSWMVRVRTDGDSPQTPFGGGQCVTTITRVLRRAVAPVAPLWYRAVREFGIEFGGLAEWETWEDQSVPSRPCWCIPRTGDNGGCGRRSSARYRRWRGASTR
jgi:hypothetical protein